MSWLTYWTRYWMHYHSLKFKDIQKLAFEEAIAYYEDKTWTRLEFRAFQDGFIRAYRSAYAKAEMTRELAQLNLA
jgi:hypothetical protein